MGIAAESGIEEPGEVTWRIGFEPGRELTDAIENLAGSLPLPHQILDDLPSPLGVDDLDLVVDVQKDRTRMC